MNDIIGNLAQELADHLEYLRGTEDGVTDHDGDARSFPITEVSDIELNKGLTTAPLAPAVTFFTTVAGQRMRVTVSAE